MGYMAIKIDFKKAYDRLRWTFIRDSLLEMRLPQGMVEIIKKCVTSPSLQILWNGEPTEKFFPSRGIRQGDPLSPYLYVVCMERLAQLIIEREIHCEVWKPVYASKNGPALSHLAFANDLILFAEASVDQARIVSACLEDFCGASESKVSLGKSRVYFSGNTSQESRSEISRCLGLEETDDLGTYLGVPTINGRMTTKEYHRVKNKLAG